jgi:branched-chain amino acid transport system permease protein
VLVRWLPKSDTPTLSSLLLMFGFWLVLQNIGYLVWGNEEKSILTPRTFSVLQFGEISVSTLRLVVFVAAVISMALLQWILNHTWFGRSMRALIQNPYAAQLVGVDDEKTARLTFGLGTAFAGFAGSLLAMIYSFTPDFGRPFLLRAFVIIVLGGLESVSGVALGAVVVALVETFSIIKIPSGYQPAIAFGLLVVVLVFMPKGIAGLLAYRRRTA